MASTVICGVCLVFAVCFVFLKKFAKLRAVAAFVASAGLAFGAFGGWGVRFIRFAFVWVQVGENKLTVLLLGVAVPGLIALALAIFFLHDIWPKHPGRMRATFIGFVLPFFLVAAGATASNLVAAVAAASPPPAVHVLTGTGS